MYFHATYFLKRCETPQNYQKSSKCRILMKFHSIRVSLFDSHNFEEKYVVWKITIIIFLKIIRVDRPRENQSICQVSRQTDENLRPTNVYQKLKNVLKSNILGYIALLSWPMYLHLLYNGCRWLQHTSDIPLEMEWVASTPERFWGTKSKTHNKQSKK